MNTPASAVLGLTLFFQLQVIPPGRTPPFLGVIYLAVTGLSGFGRESPTVFVCSLPLIGDNWASVFVVKRVPVAPITYDWLVVSPDVTDAANTRPYWFASSNVTLSLNLILACIWTA